MTNQIDTVKPDMLYVLVISHRYGTDCLGVFRTEKSMQRELYAWVKQWWDEEINQGVAKGEPGYRPIPRSMSVAIRTYFDEVDDEFIEVKDQIPVNWR